MILISMYTTVFSRRHMQAQTIRAMNHDAIRADIHPTFVGIARDHQTVGADVTAAVEFVPTRHRKLEHINVFAFLYVLEERSGGNRFGADWRNFLHLLPPSLNKIQVAQAGFHPERQSEPFDR